MKVAISGSKGFLGSHLAEVLLNKGYQILPITQEQLYSPETLAQFFQVEQPELIFHLASYGNHANQEDVAMTVFSNYIGTFNMLSASNNIPYKKFVYFSTSSVTLPKQTFYSASKRGAEEIVNVFVNTYDKPIITVRPYSVYGIGEADFHFIPTLVKSLLEEKEMEVALNPVHDWIYIDDFIEGVLIATQNANKGDIVNIGTGRQKTNKEVIDILQRISGKTLKYKEKEMRSYDTDNWHANIEQLMRWGWRAENPMGVGLLKVYEYYQQRFKKKNN